MLKKVLTLSLLTTTIYGVVGSYFAFGIDNIKYFTNQSNLLLLVMLILYLGNQKVKYQDTFNWIALFDILLTGIVYNLLLRQYEASMNPFQLTLVFINHTVNPILYLLVYILYFKQPKRVSDFYQLLLHPLIYFTFYMVFGGLLNFYPYPFMDPTIQPLSEFLITNLLILLPALVLLSLGLTQIYRINRKGDHHERI
ncbi:MAG: hypothetical protein CVV63_00575 [Tenericutes bacterium HGW-Tenericutes-8]|nr:MAG: hypothetical protein CVV63_00575 [Tenericutes bacterium HGW-Tenericutes-8]